MRPSYNNSAPRRHVNLTANSDLVHQVRQAKGNLSAIFEKSLIDFLVERELAHWKEENRPSFESYNRMIDERGSVAEDIGLPL